MTISQRPSQSLYDQHLDYVRSAFDAAMDRAGADTVVIFSGALRYHFLDDSSYPFRSNPHFMYWLPVTDLPSSYVVYRRDQKPVLLYYQPADYWHSVAGDPDPYWANHFDVRPISTIDEARAALPDGLKAPILLGEIQDPNEALGIERTNPSAALHSLDISRITKTDYELERMRQASRLGAVAHRAAAHAFHNVTSSEYEIHQAYLESIRVIDSELPYNSIVGLNEHAAVLHYQHRARQAPSERRSFLIDAGANDAGYASDITRTYSAVEGDFADLILAMDTLQQSLCGEVKEGKHYPDLHVEMHEALAQVVVNVGLSTASPEELVEKGITRALLPHGLGHYLGLQVHDVGGHLQDAKGTPTKRPERDPNLRLTRTLGNNEVVTIEPGLYFIDMLLTPIRTSGNRHLLNWTMVDELTPFGGIRIEDNVRVNGQTPENFTRDAFSAIK
ncbi:MAG: Xaa-Pro dipeptidase [Woeseiaceae bacterium]